MKKIFIVTGANGFLGNNVVRRLIEKGEGEVRALVLPGDASAPLADLPCTVFEGDVTRPGTLEDPFLVAEEAEIWVIHCAAIVSIKSKFDPLMEEVNVNGTKNIVEKVLEKGAKLVYVSSVHAIPEKPAGEVMTEVARFDPDKVEGQYGKTKAKVANYVLEAVKSRGLNACIVHPSGLMGPFDFGSSHLTQLVLDFAGGRLRACVKGGYDFADVRDVAAGIVAACEKGRRGECYILSNKYVEIRELLDAISEARNMPKIKTVLPMWLAVATAPLSELYYALRKQTPLYTRYSLYTLRSNSRFSKEKAARELGYVNRPLRETVADTVAWLEESQRLR